MIVRVLSAIMLLPFLLLPVWATTCKNPMALSDDDFRPRLDGDPVFIGTVTGLDPPLSANLQAVTVKVDRKWTNNVDDEVRVLYVGDVSTFEKEIGGMGTQRLFSTTWSKSRKMLTVTFCTLMNTEDAAITQRLIRLLGPGQPTPRKTNEPVYETDSVYSGVPIAFGFFLLVPTVLVIGLFLITKRLERTTTLGDLLGEPPPKSDIPSAPPTRDREGP